MRSKRVISFAAPKCDFRCAAGLIAAIVFVAGCQSQNAQLTSLALGPDQYNAAFEAALDASNENGFDPLLRDRRQGIIETAAVISPSIFEPWRGGSASFDQMLENTTTLQRRRIIWEFTAQQLPSEQTEGPELDVLAIEQWPLDLTRAETAMELRVLVVIERAASPGTRPSVWTTSDTTRTVIVDPVTGQDGPRTYWTPVARDARLESFLLSAVQSRLLLPQPTESAQ